MKNKTPRRRRRGLPPSIPSQQLPEIVRKLIAWRRRNSLSQRDAVSVLRSHFFRVSLASLASWEQGRRFPMPQSAHLLDELLTRFPIVAEEKTANQSSSEKKTSLRQERNLIDL
jgi:transcriptional regulator with XRE-family HTH domain